MHCWTPFRSRNSLRQLLSFGLDVRLDEVAGAGNLKDTVFELVDWAEEQGKTGELLIAAQRDNPGNPKLRAFAEEVGFTALEPPQGQAERIVNAAARFQDVETFLAGFRARERAVCRIEIPSGTGIGTGFLVGPDLVMTNHHVMEEVIRGATQQTSVGFRFGYKVEPDGSDSADRAGDGLVAGPGWLVDSTPCRRSITRWCGWRANLERIRPMARERCSGAG